MFINFLSEKTRLTASETAIGQTKELKLKRRENEIGIAVRENKTRDGSWHSTLWQSMEQIENRPILPIDRMRGKMPAD